MKDFVFKLYVAGQSPNSVRALANLNVLCAKYLSGHYKIEIVDVLKEPQQALAVGVFITPTLIKVSPAPSQKIVGDLSQQAQVLLALGLSERPE
jgi:circadian clock protein KaiB